MYGLSGEHILVLLIILLIFGPKRLPGLGQSIGRTIKGFKDGINGLSDAEGPKPEAKKSAPLLEGKEVEKPKTADQKAAEEKEKTEEKV